MESTDTRTLRIEIPPCQLAKLNGEPQWSVLAAANGWLTNHATMGLTAWWTGTIDLSGYVREMKTFYPTAGMVQKGPYLIEVGGAGSIMYTIVSSIPLVVEDVYNQLLMPGGPGFLNLGLLSGAGLGANQQNWETVIFAETEINVPNTNISPNPQGIQQPLDRNQSGSLSATATDTLYVMKLVIPLVADLTSETLQISASRVILPGKFGIEPDVEYMMRLKRSVELSQQV